MNFKNPRFLEEHIRSILAFYDHRSVDPAGGFYHCYMNNGDVFNPGLRTLVASCRFVFNYAKAYQRFGSEDYQRRVIHGVKYLRESHRNPKTGGYAWKINNGQVIDSTNHCYGLAFVLLAYATALDAGVAEARAWIDETFDVMEARFWDESAGAYACEADANWNLTDYRGQNDNMHACEALIAAFEATGEPRFLQRACLLSENFTRRFSGKTNDPIGGPIWEHFTRDWLPDLDYNKNDKTNSLRPWGVQTGHQTEWAKLLLILDRHAPETWRLERAKTLFDAAMKFGWDDNYGGLIYGYDLAGKPCDFDKYYWVQAESLAAAALLADRTKEARYWHDYERLWEYSVKFFVDQEYGAWYRILNRENARYDERKSYDNKVDYHTMGACHEVLKVLN